MLHCPRDWTGLELRWALAHWAIAGLEQNGAENCFACRCAVPVATHVDPIEIVRVARVAAIAINRAAHVAPLTSAANIQMNTAPANAPTIRASERVIMRRSPECQAAPRAQA